MMNKLILIPAFIALLGFSSTTNAAGMAPFGSKESIRFVAETELKQADGTSLYLGRRITLRSFLLPYAIEDNGYVLGITGSAGQYLPLPTGPRLKTLQANGYLPKPLPPFHLKLGDYVMGYAMEWAILVALLAAHFIRRRRGSEEDGLEEEP